MSAVNILVPVIGESVKTAVIGRWSVEVGAVVAAGQVVVTVDSDKLSAKEKKAYAQSTGQLAPFRCAGCRRGPSTRLARD